MTRALALLGFIGLLLAVDTQVDAQAQLLLGLAAWLALGVGHLDLLAPEAGGGRGREG